MDVDYLVPRDRGDAMIHSNLNERRRYTSKSSLVTYGMWGRYGYQYDWAYPSATRLQGPRSRGTWTMFAAELGRCLVRQQAALPPFEVLRVVWIGVGKQAGSELSLDPLELATELA